MNWKEYQNFTFRSKPNYLAVYAVNHFDFHNAIDLGCGSGNETVYLLKKGKNVLAVDGNLNKNFILSRLSENQKAKLTLKQCQFEEVKLPNADFIIATFTLSFCNPNEFMNLWNKIKKSLEPNGILAANLFGNRDWHINNPNVSNFTKEEVLKLLKDFELIKWKEQEYDQEADQTHWHYYDFIAKRKCEKFKQKKSDGHKCPKYNQVMES